MNPQIDAYLQQLSQWQSESKRLRTLLLKFPLQEQLKWGQPCYALQGKNVILIGGFKEYCALLFFKGALLADPDGLLVAPGKTQAGRQMRFKSLQEIAAKERVIVAYIGEAIKVEQTGLKVSLKAHSEYKIPEELKNRLDRSDRLKKCFETLSPGRQRGYILYVSAPKQAKTREARVEKCIERILEGRGVNE